jgi:hypothetical protein
MCIFNASRTVYLQKVGHKGVQETAFGLHRRERIAYGPFSEKVHKVSKKYLKITQFGHLWAPK